MADHDERQATEELAHWAEAQAKADAMRSEIEAQFPPGDPRALREVLRLGFELMLFSPFQPAPLAAFMATQPIGLWVALPDEMQVACTRCRKLTVRARNEAEEASPTGTTYRVQLACMECGMPTRATWTG